MISTPFNDRGERTGSQSEYTQALLEQILAKDYEAARTLEMNQSVRPLSGAIAKQAIDSVRRQEGKVEASSALGCAATGEM